ncbi:MAG: (4Fe-4S)-binding protein [Dehalococcoidia bacterium]|nr:(4Fe-4S)-binding protein [Dehalococcoidia bacterium]MDD5494158.1 (4Fe-4S)-binding protein [Dehalococcoidia bacterium]
MKRVYRTDKISVYWDSEKCAHSGVCFSRLPQVFKPGARPWVKIQSADPLEIKRVIEACPSGALTCKLNR